MTGQLETRSEVAGQRHYLNDQPVHCGDSLELRKENAWIRGRYEWNWRHQTQPGFFVSQGEAILLTEHDILRWPGQVS